MSPEVETIAAWIRCLHPELVEVDPDLDLIETRLIDSLAFAEYLIRVEQLAAAPIDADTLNVDDFRTLRRLERAFFAGSAL